MVVRGGPRRARSRAGRSWRRETAFHPDSPFGERTALPLRRGGGRGGWSRKPAGARRGGSERLSPQQPPRTPEGLVTAPPLRLPPPDGRARGAEPARRSPLPLPRPARRAERARAPTLGGGVFGWRSGQGGGGKGEGTAEAPTSYKRAVPGARFLHSQESRSEPGAISEPRSRGPAERTEPGAERAAPRVQAEAEEGLPAPISARPRCPRPGGVPGRSGSSRQPPRQRQWRGAPSSALRREKLRVRRLHRSAHSPVTPGAPSVAASPRTCKE